MTDQHDTSPSTVLETAIAHAISRAQSIVDDGAVNLDGLAAADAAELADALTTASRLVTQLESIRAGLAEHEADDATETETDEQTARPDVVTALDILRDVRALTQMVYYAGEHEQNECIAATANLIHEKLRAVFDALGESRP